MAADLHQLALQAAKKSYSPYSKFPVGAVIKTTDGRIYSGCNIENAAYPEGWCAETSAISHMIMDGGGEIAEVAVLGLKADLCTPCGGCRQRLAEFGSEQTKIHLCDQEKITDTITLGELLPKSFKL
ncbi:MAG: cytidine deaminase [Rhizobiales bacterium]|nr:cytidine deaminase [Hyphomicrobiales bacterium]